MQVLELTSIQDGRHAWTMSLSPLHMKSSFQNTLLFMRTKDPISIILAGLGVSIYYSYFFKIAMSCQLHLSITVERCITYLYLYSFSLFRFYVQGIREETWTTSNIHRISMISLMRTNASLTKEWYPLCKCLRSRHTCS